MQAHTHAHAHRVGPAVLLSPGHLDFSKHKPAVSPTPLPCPPHVSPGEKAPPGEQCLPSPSCSIRWSLFPLVPPKGRKQKPACSLELRTTATGLVRASLPTPDWDHPVVKASNKPTVFTDSLAGKSTLPPGLLRTTLKPGAGSPELRHKMSPRRVTPALQERQAAPVQSVSGVSRALEPGLWRCPPSWWAPSH